MPLTKEAARLLRLAATNRRAILQVSGRRWDIEQYTRRAEYNAEMERYVAEWRPLHELMMEGLIDLEPENCEDNPPRIAFRVTDTGLLAHRAMAELL